MKMSRDSVKPPVNCTMGPDTPEEKKLNKNQTASCSSDVKQIFFCSYVASIIW